MISPWSTNPQTTKDRPYVFRACFLDPFQGPVAAKFATEEFQAKKAAVLYDIASDYPKGLAEYFKEAFEKIHGAGSVVAFETFTTKDRDFSAQLTNIIKSGADVLFTPQYYDEVPLIVKQAHQLGWKKPIMGSDSWGSAELMKLCGDDCKGLYFTTIRAAEQGQPRNSSTSTTPSTVTCPMTWRPSRGTPSGCFSRPFRTRVGSPATWKRTGIT